MEIRSHLWQDFQRWLACIFNTDVLRARDEHKQVRKLLEAQRDILKSEAIKDIETCLENLRKEFSGRIIFSSPRRTSQCGRPKTHSLPRCNLSRLGRNVSCSRNTSPDIQGVLFPTFQDPNRIHATNSLRNNRHRPKYD